jgi:aromatic ring-opening dioxygenase LigB subunit
MGIIYNNWKYSMEDIMSEKKEISTESEELGLAIPMKWKPISDIPTIYANNLLISHGGGEFYLVFGEMIPPFIIDTNIDKIPEVVDIRPVARIAVTPENIERFADALIKNIEKYRNRNDNINNDTEMKNA